MCANAKTCGRNTECGYPACTDAARPGGPDDAPKTRLAMHVPAGVCVGPGTRPLELFIEDTATGERTKLK